MRRLALLLPLLLAGCGGRGGGSSAHPAKSGRAVLKVKWPDRKARLIPSAANSLVVTLATADGTLVGAPKTIERPPTGSGTTSTTFAGLPYGDLRASVAAYPSGDGTGVAQASGADTLLVEEDEPGSVDVALASTVSALSVTPESAYVPVGGTATLTATARDASGALVLLAANGGSDVTWVSYEPRVATLTGNGPTATLKGLTT